MAEVLLKDGTKVRIEGPPGLLLKVKSGEKEVELKVKGK